MCWSLAFLHWRQYTYQPDGITIGQSIGGLNIPWDCLHIFRYLLCLSVHRHWALRSVARMYQLLRFFGLTKIYSYSLLAKRWLRSEYTAIRLKYPYSKSLKIIDVTHRDQRTQGSSVRDGCVKLRRPSFGMIGTVDTNSLGWKYSLGMAVRPRCIRFVLWEMFE